jgi:beta-xylosidase
MTRFCVAAAAIVVAIAPALALNGQPPMHDPSTVIEAGGKFYVYATGGGLPAFESDDGWTWRRAGSVMQAVPGGRPGADVIARGGNNTWAPDIIHVGDKYFLYYAAPGTQPKAAVGLLVGRTLDPSSPDYTWEDGGPVVWSDGVEDSNAIDPGVMRDPTNGTMWLTYGSYFGYIRLVELDPKTGRRLHTESDDRRQCDTPVTTQVSNPEAKLSDRVVHVPLQPRRFRPTPSFFSPDRPSVHSKQDEWTRHGEVPQRDCMRTNSPPPSMIVLSSRHVSDERQAR